MTFAKLWSYGLVLLFVLNLSLIPKGKTVKHVRTSGHERRLQFLGVRRPGHLRLDVILSFIRIRNIHKMSS